MRPTKHVCKQVDQGGASKNQRFASEAHRSDSRGRHAEAKAGLVSGATGAENQIMEWLRKWRKSELKKSFKDLPSATAHEANEIANELEGTFPTKDCLGVTRFHC